LRFVGNPARKLFRFDGRKTSTPVQVLHFDSWEFAVYSRLAVALDWRRAL
jgi:hypothetical protein